MKRYRVIICNLVCLTCLFLLPQGCDSKSEAPATPKIVRKKIVAQANTKAARPQAKNVRIPKTQKAVKRVPPKASTPVAVARQDSSATVQKSQTPAAAPRQAVLFPWRFSVPLYPCPWWWQCFFRPPAAPWTGWPDYPGGFPSGPGWF